MYSNEMQLLKYFPPLSLGMWTSLNQQTWFSALKLYTKRICCIYCAVFNMWRCISHCSTAFPLTCPLLTVCAQICGVTMTLSIHGNLFNNRERHWSSARKMSFTLYTAFCLFPLWDKTVCVNVPRPRRLSGE